MKLCDFSLCIGCGACAQVCPVDCIDMKENRIGHMYPYVNEEKCISCGKCTRVCPVLNPPEGRKSEKVYALYSNDLQERRESTSGGAANVFSRYVISQNGSVYGAALTPDGIHHIRVDNIADLAKLKGSKYVQSPVSGIYEKLKSDVDSGSTVLFIGTPCQCAAVRSFLGRDYENLWIIDLVCTGVPPQKLLWEHLGEIPDEIRFRDGSGTRLTAVKNGKLIYKKPVYDDYFLMGFAKHLYFRESCYICPFASDERVSDITLGDFWGLGKIKPFSKSRKDGVSEVFVNTAKGQKLLDFVLNEVYAEEREIYEAVSYNPRYNSPSTPHKNKMKFEELYQKNGFKKALKASMKQDRIKYCLYRQKRWLKNLLKR